MYETSHDAWQRGRFGAETQREESGSQEPRSRAVLPEARAKNTERAEQQLQCKGEGVKMECTVE